MIKYVKQNPPKSVHFWTIICTRSLILEWANWSKRLDKIHKICINIYLNKNAYNYYRATFTKNEVNNQVKLVVCVIDYLSWCIFGFPCELCDRLFRSVGFQDGAAHIFHTWIVQWSSSGCFGNVAGATS